MFVVTLRKGGLKKAGIVCACGVLLVAAALGVNALRFKGSEAEAAQAAAPMTSQITGAQDLLTFLRGYGVEGDAATATVNAVMVPRKWDDSFKAFHAVVEKSGLSLKKCKGKEVDKWMTLIPSQCTEDVKTYAVVLVYKNEPKAAYLLQKPSGEVLPLVAAATTGASLPLTEEEMAANATFGEGAESANTAASGVAETAGTADSAAQDAAAAQATADAAVDAGAYPTE